MKIKIKIKKHEIRDLLALITQAKEAGVFGTPALLIESREFGLKLVEILSRKDDRAENDTVKIPVEHWHRLLFYSLSEFAAFEGGVYYKLLIDNILQTIIKETDEAARKIAGKWNEAGRGDHRRISGAN